MKLKDVIHNEALKNEGNKETEDYIVAEVFLDNPSKKIPDKLDQRIALFSSVAHIANIDIYSRISYHKSWSYDHIKWS